MKAASMRVLLTGASGGIGSAIARELAAHGAAVMLVGRDEGGLQRLAESLGGPPERVQACAADMADDAGREHVSARAEAWGCNVLINNAGLGEFAFVDQQTDAGIERLFAINAIAPMQLTRRLLGRFLSLPEAAVLNVGSVFGSLAYPGFAAYSASKFALRGYTEALRREVAGSNVNVHYLAPRATRTSMNASAVERMNAELGVAMDAPVAVARAARELLERGRSEAVMGWPEKFFVRINALLPRVVDGSLRKQLPVIRRHAENAAAERCS
jgi:short-subunit dehydrogenase